MGRQQEVRALRLDVGNFSWGSECAVHKARITDVVYKASNNELVHTNTLETDYIVLMDRTLYQYWYTSHWALSLSHKMGPELTPDEKESLNKNNLRKFRRNMIKRRMAQSEVLQRAVPAGKLLARIASRPGRCCHTDGYVVEGKSWSSS